MSENDRKFEPIFERDADHESNALVGWTPYTVELYIMGYKKAGDELARYVLGNDHYLDYLVLPLAFLYRQYIELRLKEIIKEGRALLGKERSSPITHDVLKLWSIAKEIATEVFKNDNEPPDLEYAEHVISEFAKVDPGSFSFRYPTTKDGQMSIEGVDYIGVERLARHVEDLAKDLDKLSIGISVYNEWQEDMLSNC